MFPLTRGSDSLGLMSCELRSLYNVKCTLFTKLWIQNSFLLTSATELIKMVTRGDLLHFVPGVTLEKNTMSKLMQYSEISQFYKLTAKVISHGYDRNLRFTVQSTTHVQIQCSLQMWTVIGNIMQCAENSVTMLQRYNGQYIQTKQLPCDCIIPLSSHMDII